MDFEKNWANIGVLLLLPNCRALRRMFACDRYTSCCLMLPPLDLVHPLSYISRVGKLLIFIIILMKCVIRWCCISCHGCFSDHKLKHNCWNCDLCNCLLVELGPLMNWLDLNGFGLLEKLKRWNRFRICWLDSGGVVGTHCIERDIVLVVVFGLGLSFEKEAHVKMLAQHVGGSRLVRRLWLSQSDF